MKLTRRKLLYSLLGTSLLPAGIGVYAWRIEPHWVEFVHRDLPLLGLPSDWVNKTLVQISDLHVGPIVDSQYLIYMLKRINQIKPDILVITGDFITYGSTEQFDELVRVLKNLPNTKIGTFGILGNHDYGYGWRQEKVADQMIKHAVDSGIHILRNEIVNLNGLQIAGLDDYWGPNFSPEKVMSQLHDNHATLILSHNPDTADHPAMTNIKGWILSGHTHGGQCKPPFLPPPVLPVKNKRYTSGAFDLQNGRSMYINRGLGHLIRIRLNVRPEVTVFTLKNLV